MRAYRWGEFGLDKLKLESIDSPRAGPGQVLIDIKAVSLNYRDLLVIKGLYNPKLKLPAVPLSDGAGVISAVGDGVERVRVGDRVTSHFVSGWIDGPFCGEYVGTTLGLPGGGFEHSAVRSRSRRGRSRSRGCARLV